MCIRDRGWCDLPCEKAAELLGRRLDEIAVELHHRRCIVDLVEHRAADDVAHLMESKLEAGDDAEVAAPAPQRPEEVLILRVTGRDLATVGEYDIGGEQVVDRQPVPARQVADSAAEGEAAYAGRRDDPTRSGKAERVGGVVDVTPGCPATDTGSAFDRVHGDSPHGRQIDDKAVVDGAKSGNAVPTAAHGEIQPAVDRRGNRRHHVRGVDAVDHGSGPAVVHRVVYGPSLVVVNVFGGDNSAPRCTRNGFDDVGHARSSRVGTGHEILRCITTPSGLWRWRTVRRTVRRTAWRACGPSPRCARSPG